jgi:pimeloyl-ACP methyl ester carboxylesterase
VLLATAAISHAQESIPWVRHATGNHGVIIFVHGVTGDAHETWKSGDAFFPEMLTHDPAFDGQNIYVYQYPTATIGHTFAVSEVADNMRLVLTTDGVLQHEQLTFVSHSMGGIVTRNFLLRYRDVVPKVRMLYFFATPTTGSPYSRLAAYFSRNPQFRQLYPMQADNYLGVMQQDWLAADFGLKSFCGYETQQLPLVGFIVDLQSATALCNKRLDPINATHITIVKPKDRNATAFRALKEAFLESAPSRPSSNHPNPTDTPRSGTKIISPIKQRYFYLSFKPGADFSPYLSNQLVVTNPGADSFTNVVAIFKTGTAPLYQRTLNPEAGIDAVDRPLTDPPPIKIGNLPPGGKQLLFSLSAGNYIFELRSTRPEINLTEQLQIVHRNGEWITSLDVYNGSTLIFTTPKPADQPDIDLQIYNTASPVILLGNKTSVLLKDPFYRVVLWRLAAPDHPLVWSNSLREQWIRRDTKLGPFPLGTDRPFKQGEELYGYAVLSCPDCADTKAYMIGINIGGQGWYSELEPGQFPWSTETFVKGLRWKVNDIPIRPGEKRISIVDTPLY